MGWEDGNKATDNRKLIFFIPIMHLSSCKTNKVVQLSDVHHGGQKRNAYENRLKLNTHGEVQWVTSGFCLVVFNNFINDGNRWDALHIFR